MDALLSVFARGATAQATIWMPKHNQANRIWALQII
jgi:hypothetical protein